MPNLGHSIWRTALYIIFACACAFPGAANAQSGGRGMSGMGGPGGGGGPGGPKGPEERQRKFIPLYAPENAIPIKEVKIIGNRAIGTPRIESMIRTRTGRGYDPEQVQNDVRTLVGSGLFRDVRHYRRDVSGGVSVTFEVFERPITRYVHFVGNEKIKDKILRKNVGMAPGDPLNRFGVEESRRQIESFYRSKGYSLSHVSVIKGLKPTDDGVAFQIHEGPKQKIRATQFVGNSIATDARLKTQIKSKPGWFYVFGGQINEEQLDQDVERLTMYYRGLGFFRARVGRQVEFDANQKWSRVKFVIDEGPRYRIRDIRVDGAEDFNEASLLANTDLREGEYFNLSRMQRDLSTLRDEYGGQGYIFADIQANPQFFEQPGIMDVVYNVKEGTQYRVGRIHVNIDGENSHTRRNVVLNRLSIKPGDVVDVRKIRSSERRLQQSQLFMAKPQQGVMPTIEVKPTADSIADERGSLGNGTFRGQSPTKTRIVDLFINLPANQ